MARGATKIAVSLPAPLYQALEKARCESRKSRSATVQELCASGCAAASSSSSCLRPHPITVGSAMPTHLSIDEISAPHTPQLTQAPSAAGTSRTIFEPDSCSSSSRIAPSGPTSTSRIRAKSFSRISVCTSRSPSRTKR